MQRFSVEPLNTQLLYHCLVNDTGLAFEKHSPCPTFLLSCGSMKQEKWRQLAWLRRQLGDTQKYFEAYSMKSFTHAPPTDSIVFNGSTGSKISLSSTSGSSIFAPRCYQRGTLLIILVQKRHYFKQRSLE